MAESAIKVAHVELHELHSLLDGQSETVLGELGSIRHDADRKPFHLLEHLGGVGRASVQQKHGVQANSIHKAVHRKVILATGYIRRFRLGFDIVEQTTPHGVCKHIEDLVPTVEESDIKLEKTVLLSNSCFGDFICSSDILIDVVGDWLVVLEDDRFADRAVELPPVDFVEVDLLVDRERPIEPAFRDSAEEVFPRFVVFGEGSMESDGVHDCINIPPKVFGGSSVFDDFVELVWGESNSPHKFFQIREVNFDIIWK